MMRIILPSTFSLLLATNSLVANAQIKPNIILIYSDDHGWADLGAQGVNGDIHTPNLDKMAAEGIRFTHGYTSAPQSVPSRAGVLTGRYQQRFGVEENGMGPLPLTELTISERLKEVGYVSCQVGKWHLGTTSKVNGKRKKQDSESTELDVTTNFRPKDQGFDEYYCGALHTFQASHDLHGYKLTEENSQIKDHRFRCIWQADAGVQFINRHTSAPFFLYLAFFAPHVPLESPEPWFSQTDKNLPLKRRKALAMIAAMDDGIGKIRETLREQGLDKNTLIFFVGDNGAPLRNAWNGSINLPLVGEKGMLTDGGIRTPFLAVWPGMLPAGKVEHRAVSTLDVAATAVSIAGLKNKKNLDGVDLIPYLQVGNTEPIHDALYWRWRSQAAILMPPYKLIRLGPTEKYLFDTTTPEGEKETKNCITQYPKIAEQLEKKLMEWSASLPFPGLPRAKNDADERFYNEYVKGK